MDARAGDDRDVKRTHLGDLGRTIKTSRQIRRGDFVINYHIINAKTFAKRSVRGLRKRYILRS